VLGLVVDVATQGALGVVAVGLALGDQMVIATTLVALTVAAPFG
jgi:hypothetical protein